MIHVTGSFAGLAGLIIIGPRYGRFGQHKSVFDESKKRQHHIIADSTSPTKTTVPLNALDTQPLKLGDVKSTSSVEEEDPSAFTLENIKKLRSKVVEDTYDEFGPSDLAMTLTGALFLWLGFIFFNAGSSIIMSESPFWLMAERAAANTFLAGAAAGLFALIFKHPLIHGFHAKRTLRDDACTVGNAFLGGMVANGAGMNTYEPWEALVVGMIGALFYILLCWLFEKQQWDDALEAFQLHGGCGTAGVWAAAFFNHITGIFHHGPGKTLGWHILVWLVIASWTFVFSYIIFYVLNRYGWLRIDLKTEIVGTDFIDYADVLRFDSRRKIEDAGHSQGHSGTGTHIEIAYQQAPKTEKTEQ
jgi:ammonia channel protein AmtB